MDAKLESIWIKRMKKGPMDPKEEAILVEGKGLKGNANQGGKRQVTLIEKEKWERVCQEIGVAVNPKDRRANLLVSGIDLANTRGKYLAIGDTLIRIYGETRPCNRMEETQNGLQQALDPNWRGGAFGEVMKGGSIKIGDKVMWMEKA
ncbi:MAG: MOSC domain-containing protein [Bacteroidota bacterium]